MAEVDPRFDPQYQRGYDPAKHGTPARPSRPARTQLPPPVADIPHDTPTPSAESPQLPDHEELAEVEEEGGVRRNPFRVVLLLVSIAAIGGAGVLLWRRISQDPYGGYGGYGGDVGQIFAQQFTDALLAPLLTGGVLGLCLWLALGALRSRP